MAHTSGAGRSRKENFFVLGVFPAIGLSLVGKSKKYDYLGYIFLS